MYPYISLTADAEQEMLKTIGLSSMDELFSDIPADTAFKGDLDLPKAKSELEVAGYLSKLANMNVNTDQAVNFLGGGAYDHYIPAVVGRLTGIQNFYTSYTPYQPEVSQGTLQYIFEYQTMIANLTGMDLANASLYDKGSGVAEAALMCHAVNRKNKVLVSKGVSPHSRRVLETYTHAQKMDIVEIPLKAGLTDLDALKEAMDDNVSSVIIQSPNYLGFLEDVEKATGIAHEVKKTSLIYVANPIALALLKKPGEMDVDVVIGEGQPLGIPLSFGGPYLGFMALKKDYMRKMPGRVVGQTVDLDGKRSWVLTLSAREQHIRREKATSNICSNQGLNTLAAAIYMAVMGKKGLKEVAMQSMQKAHYAAKKLTESGKYKLICDCPFMYEFAITGDFDPVDVQEKLLEKGILGGFGIGSDYPDYPNAMLFAVTEKRTKEEIDALAAALEEV
ncbi:MAG: aminomethyl-transferring glycine dehydrogenase subunit GcvPA [Tissierellia bacterium]|jgi:glycine dehydrogenase subunit 1|nr:aminomethyl-transferring glycine dehydrogenase subunit GcvPA [Bacillota bacterium]NLK58210.1 aminomethyl-transferring glycine dehydrogenase subunit GcvPA [Tissierellia bacterium]